MNKKEKVFQAAGETFEFARQYARQQVEYLRLEFAERSAKTTANLITAMVVAAIGLVFMIMLSIAAGFYLGNKLDSMPLAFLFVALFYLLLAIVVYAFRRKLVTNPVLSSILHSFLN